MLGAPMDRSELERLDRDTLIARAEETGVPRARILTRPELVDELLTRAGLSRPEEVVRMRGLFGRARDLLTRVIERGLHLPDAAERIRERLSLPTLPQEPPLPTVTLAEIYAAQGHPQRAIDTLRDVLAREPDHASARRLYQRLTDEDYEGPEPPSFSIDEDAAAQANAAEAGGGDDDETLAADDDDAIGYDELRAEALDEEAVDDETDETELDDDDVELVDEEADEASLASGPSARTSRDDECVAIPVDRESLFVHWAVSAETREHLQRARPGGVLVLRALLVVPTWDGPKSTARDLDIATPHGDILLEELPPGAVVRAAIGWRVGAELHPIAHAPALEALESDTGGVVRTVARWTPRGFVHVDAEDRDAPAIDRAFDAMRVRASAAD